MILIWTSFFLIMSRKNYRLMNFLIFISSGILGFIVLNSETNESLLPLFTGFFAFPLLINSIIKKTVIPKQKNSVGKIKINKIKRPFIITSIISPICSILPGLGSSQGAIIGSKLIKSIKEDEFLILLGSINTLVMATSFITIITLKKFRTGASIALYEITNKKPSLIIIILTIILSSIISILIFLFILNIISSNIHKIKYTKISIITITFLLIIILYLSNLKGLSILFLSTTIGLSCEYLKISRHLLMGSLIIPTIIYYI